MKFFKQSQKGKERLSCEYEGEASSVEPPTTASPVETSVEVDSMWTPVAKAKGGLWAVPAGENVFFVDLSKKWVRLLRRGCPMGDEVHFEAAIPSDCTIVHYNGLLFAVFKGSTVVTIDPSTGTTSFICRGTGKYRLGTPVIFGELLYFFGGQQEGSKKLSSNIRAFDLVAEKWVTKTGFATKLPFKDAQPLVLYTNDILVVAKSDTKEVVAYNTRLEAVDSFPVIEPPAATTHVTCCGDTALFVTSDAVVGKQLVEGGWATYTTALPPIVSSTEIQAIARTGSSFLIHTTAGEVWLTAPLDSLGEFPAFAAVLTPSKKKHSAFDDSDDLKVSAKVSSPQRTSSFFSKFSMQPKGYQQQLYDDTPFVAAGAN